MVCQIDVGPTKLSNGSDAMPGLMGEDKCYEEAPVDLRCD